MCFPIEPILGNKAWILPDFFTDLYAHENAGNRRMHCIVESIKTLSS